jgi:hypothetical protein
MIAPAIALKYWRLPVSAPAPCPPHVVLEPNWKQAA